MSGKAASGLGSPAETGPVQTWSVYLLSCADGTLYCGVTTDVQKRLAMHNGLRPGGARYTRGRRPVSLAACADGLTRSEALCLEARIKKEPRAHKIAVLEACTTAFRAEEGAQVVKPCGGEAPPLPLERKA